MPKSLNVIKSALPVGAPKAEAMDCVPSPDAGADIVEPRKGTGIGALLPSQKIYSDLVVHGKGKTLGNVLANPTTTWLEREQRVLRDKIRKV